MVKKHEFKKLKDYSAEELDSAKHDLIRKKEEAIFKMEEEKKSKEEEKKSKEVKQIKKDQKVKGKVIKVTVGEKEYQVPESQIYDLSKKEYKIKEDKKKINQGEVCVLFLRESSTGEIKYVKPSNGMFIVEGRYYHMIDSCIFNIGPKRIPLAVIPEWSFIPLSKKVYKDSLGSKEAESQALIIKSLENAEIVKINQDNQPPRKTDSKLIIWIIIAAVIGIYVLSKITGTT